MTSQKDFLVFILTIFIVMTSSMLFLIMIFPHTKKDFFLSIQNLRKRGEKSEKRD